MRVRVARPDQLDDLVRFLSDGNATVRQVSDEELEVSLLGSYRPDAMRMELYLRLRAWEAAHRGDGTRVEIVD